MTAVADQAAIQTESGNDATGTGIITFGNTVTVGNRLIIDGHTSNRNAIDDPFATGQNSLLPRQGADITALFGVGKGIDYKAVLKDYVDPSTPKFTNDPASISVTNYGPALVAFVEKLGISAQSPTVAWVDFEKLSPKLQAIFAYQVYFNELKLAGVDGQPLRGFKVIETLFPDGEMAEPATADRPDRLYVQRLQLQCR